MKLFINLRPPGIILHKEHICVAADLLVAAKTGDTKGFTTANELWHQNGNDIAAFLNTANPEHFGLNDWQQMMKSHLDLTLCLYTLLKINKGTFASKDNCSDLLD